MQASTGDKRKTADIETVAVVTEMTTKTADSGED